MDKINLQNIHRPRKLKDFFDVLVDEINDLNSLTAPARAERVKKRATEGKEAERQAAIKAKADAKAKRLADAKALLTQNKARKEAERKADKAQADAIAEAEKLVEAHTPKEERAKNDEPKPRKRRKRKKANR